MATLRIPAHFLTGSAPQPEGSASEQVTFQAQTGRPAPSSSTWVSSPVATRKIHKTGSLNPSRLRRNGVAALEKENVQRGRNLESDIEVEATRFAACHPRQ